MNNIIYIIILIVLLLVIIVYILFYLVSYKLQYIIESSSGYECGFNFIRKTRISFSYRFFLIGILFLIFDVEIVLLLTVPYILRNIIAFNIFLLFLLVLIIGLIYEYYCGSLEWIELLISKA